MVWGLFPVDPVLGEDSYYIIAKGIYKVGRKGCDIIVKKDKGVSRIHAEILVDSMISLDPEQNKSSNISFKVRIRDCSKYGTFINKNLGSQVKLHEFPEKETTLKDGDLVSFGTGNATYRFAFVPLIFFVYCSERFSINQYLQDKISSIGASITLTWSPECTHVIVDQFMHVKEDLVDIFLAKKPLVLIDWIEFVAEQSIRTEIPSFNDYVPTLTCEGVSVKVGDSISRQKCLKGFTFLLEPAHKYIFGGRLQSLLEASGAKVDSIDGLCSCSQSLEEGENNRLVHVIPARSADKARVRFHNTGPSWVPGVIVVSIEDGHAGVPGLSQLDPLYSYIVVIINPGPTEIKFASPALQGRALRLHPEQLMSTDKEVKNSTYEASSGCFTVPPRTMSVFVEHREI